MSGSHLLTAFPARSARDDSVTLLRDGPLARRSVPSVTRSLGLDLAVMWLSGTIDTLPTTHLTSGRRDRRHVAVHDRGVRDPPDAINQGGNLTSRSTSSRWFRLLALLLGLSLIAAACGGDDDDSATPEGDDETSETDTATRETTRPADSSP